MSSSLNESLQGLEAEAKSKPSERTPKVFPEKFFFGIFEAAEALSISPNHLIHLIKANRIAVRRLGRRVLISREELVRLASRDRAEPGDISARTSEG